MRAAPRFCPGSLVSSRTRPRRGVLEEECHNLLSLAATQVFSHLLLCDLSFNLKEVIGPVPKESHDSLVAIMEGYVGALLERFSCGGEDPGDQRPFIVLQ